jgi:hypothetical protein
MSMRLVLLVALALVTTLASAASFSSLEERMSQAEFHAAGLDKLSPDELKALDTWLAAHYTTATTYVTPSGSPVFYPQESKRDTVESHIVGTFTGWRGQTVFTLDNGQQWKQAESGSYDCGTFQNPKVTIKPMLLGSWLMYVEACRSQSLRVTRIK